MCRNILQSLSIALIYCGTVFGAGFASGQEIFRFFSAHGRVGIISAIFVGFLFVLLGSFLCFYAKRWKLQDASSFFQHIFSAKTAGLMNFFCTAFLILSFCIMIVGCATLASEQFGTRPITGAVWSLALCFLIIRNRVRGLAIFNGIITPFLFFCVTALCMAGLFSKQSAEIVFPTNYGKGTMSGILYLSYNMLPAAAVLIPAAHLTETEKDAALGGGIGGMLIGIPLVLMTVLLSCFPDAERVQMPFFSFVCNTYQKMAPLCGAVLYGAMLTTATSSGVSVLSQASERHTKTGAILLCVAALIFSFIPFRTLVETVYTIFGFCGVVLMYGICKTILRKK